MEVVEWGTWEELILVSAVLRHGTDEWEAVANELRSRTYAPGRFTVEVCKEKYDDLQQHYSTCSDLLEGLRKQRIAELKRTLEKSDDSIGFLQSKLRNINFEKGHSSSVDYQSSPCESPGQTSVGQSSGKYMSKDGLSAGSYTQEISNVQSSPIYTPIVQTLQQLSTSIKLDTMPITGDLFTCFQGWGIGVKKKRGKRKRRGGSQQVKEENLDELALDSANKNLHLLSCIKVEPTSECDLGSQPYIVSKCSQGTTDALKCNELTRIFDLVASNEYASIFKRRCDGQKRARYRMMVRQHMDLDLIKCRIDKQAITSTMELLRDLLLLATNAAIFYSRNTREHKYAVILRGVVKKLVMEHKKSSMPAKEPVVFAMSPVSVNAPHIPPVNNTWKKLKTANPDSHKFLDKLKTDEDIISKAVQDAKKTSTPKHLHQTKTISQTRKVNRSGHNAKDVSRQHPQTKSGSINAHNTKDGSMH